MILTLFLVGTIPAVLAEDTEVTSGEDNSLDQREKNSANLKERVISSKGKLQKFQEQRKHFLESREKLKRIKGKVGSCPKTDSEECKDLRKESLAKSHDHLIKTIERMISMLEKTRERVEKSDMENKEDVLERIDEKIDKAKEILEEVNSLEDPTKEELKTTVKELRENWKGSKSVIKNGQKRVMDHRFKGVLMKSEKLSERLGNIVDKLEEGGSDVSEIRVHLDSFNEKLATAKETFESARESNDKATLREVHSSLKEAHKELKETVRLIKSLKKDSLEGDEE